MRRITALAAAAMLGATAPAAARVAPGGYDARLGATLERSWSWATSTACGPESGAGRRVLRVRAPRSVRVGPDGGSIPVVGTLALSGRADTWETSGAGSCVQRQERCPTTRSAIRGSVRLTIRGSAVRLSNLRYRVLGRAGCAPDVPAVRAALEDEARFERVVVRDREGKLRNPRIARVTVRAAYAPSAQLGGNVTGTVDARVSWSLVLARR